MVMAQRAPISAKSISAATPHSVRAVPHLPRSCLNAVTQSGVRCSPRAVVLHASSVRGGAAPADTVSRDGSPIIGLVSACLEADEHAQRFEVIAGRSAMVGVVTALITECVTEQNLFHSLSQQELTTGATYALVCVLASAALAFCFNRDTTGSRFKESVLTSLTAVKRSASSITQYPVDKRVDELLETFIGISRMCSAILVDELVN